MRTLVIVNPNAAGGKAGAVFKKLQDQLFKKIGDYIVAFTERPEEVAEHLDAAAMVDIHRLIAIGGDGTNHAVV
ncbi:MAG: diacylglycerol kinase family protein, partial [Candidatus Aminicenantes bacterium]|nr:diacylglycerol kinase family protein [Candidatus Aminicenantes bacterium]